MNAVRVLDGTPPGWISDLPLPRTAQLRALGNGVVPPQAAYAISLLRADLDEIRDEVWLAGDSADDGREA